MALRKAPGERYQTAEALAEDLRRYLSGEPVRARADSAWYRFGKFLARNRIAACASAVVLAAMAAQAAISVQQKQRGEGSARSCARLSARSGAVIDFVNSMLADVAPSRGPISIAATAGAQLPKLARGSEPPEHEAAVLALLAQFFSNNSNAVACRSDAGAFAAADGASTDMALRGQLLCQSASAATWFWVGSRRRAPRLTRDCGWPARTISRRSRATRPTRGSRGRRTILIGR